MSPRDLRLLLAVLTVVGSVCVLPLALGGPIDLLLAAPVLLLALPLLSGRYVGEAQLERLARCASARRRPVRGLAARTSPVSTGGARLPRGGALLAFSLAVRPPPAAVAIR